MRTKKQANLGGIANDVDGGSYQEHAHTYTPPLVRQAGADGRQQWISKEGYTVETGHITDQCPTYRTDAMYRCSICALARITAFNSKFECPKVRNPNKIQEELKVILIDEEGYELEQADQSGND